MPKGLCKQSMEIIASVLDYFEKERDNGKPLLPLTSVRERVAAAVGRSLSTVSRISSLKKKNEPISSPKRKRNKSKPIIDVDDASKTSIPNVIYEMYRNRQHITRQSLLGMLKERDIFNGGMSSLSKVLKEMGFRWKKDDPRRGLMELQHIALMRIDFLQFYVGNINNNNYKQCVFLDETWIFENGSSHYSWQDDNPQTVKKVKTEGRRYIVLHAGSKEGFVPGASLIFSSVSKNPDYHGDMNKENFTKWFTNQLLPNLKPKSLIVVDNASYHSEIVNKSPNGTWRKGDIQDWLTSNNIHYETNMLKPQLLHLVSLYKPPKQYVIDNIATAHGHKILRLPPYHCIFNPIEHIWGISKTYYNKHIGRDGYGVQKCLEMWQESLKTISAETWLKTVEHTEAEIIRWWEREVGFEMNEISPLIINFDEDSSSSSDIYNSDE